MCDGTSPDYATKFTYFRTGDVNKSLLELVCPSQMENLNETESRFDGK
ncbi:MAG: hypothetical protein MAG795_00989 [Candidatus Woesearchaeota archaeon]|nr:hypothetical protein [Candidatus Woesearchaeota archaeon]